MARKKTNPVLPAGANSEDLDSHPVDPYHRFALIYDLYMEHVPYGAWATYLYEVATRLCGKGPRTVLDLGCGTGQLLAHLQGRVRRLVGVDGSESMLARARMLLPDIHFLRASLTARLPFRSASVPWIVCTHDCLNYLTDEADLRRHLREVARILAPGGLYSTDFVSLRNILANFDRRTIRRKLRGVSFEWSNRYDRSDRLMISELTFHGRDGKSYRETHRQRFYDRDEILSVASGVGLTAVAEEGDYTHRDAREADSLWNFHFRVAG